MVSWVADDRGLEKLNTVTKVRQLAKKKKKNQKTKKTKNKKKTKKTKTNILDLDLSKSRIQELTCLSYVGFRDVAFLRANILPTFVGN